MNRRNTIQKGLVMDAVHELKSHVTAEAIYEYIREKHPSIGKGTVYRNLGVLVEEGELRRVEIPDGPDRFDFTLKDHYHVRCIKCSKVFDVDMDIISDFKERIRDAHGIQFLEHDIMFKGLCPECQENH